MNHLPIIFTALLIGAVACGSASAGSTTATTQELPAACQKPGVMAQALKIMKEVQAGQNAEAEKDLAKALPGSDLYHCIYTSQSSGSASSAVVSPATSVKLP